MKTRFVTLILLAIVALFAMPALAQELAAPAAAVDSGGAVGFVNSIIDKLQDKAPWLAAIVFIMGGLRAAIKPLMEAFHAYVKATPSQADDEFYEKVQNSKWLKWTVKVLDYAASVKLIHPKAK